MANIVLSIMMLAAIALVAGAIYLLRRGGPRKQPFLMLVLAVILVVNAAIISVPNAAGIAPATGVVE